MELVSAACRATLVLVFLVSGTSKLRRGEVRALAETVGGSGLVRRGAAGAVARGVVVLELLVVVLVVAVPTARAGAALAAVLLTGFLVAIALSLRTGAGLTCRCFGVRAEAVGRRHLVRNGALLAVCAGAVAAPPPLTPAHAPVLVCAALLAATAALVVVLLDDVIDAVHALRET